MEINKELGTISEKELEEIASKAADAAGGSEITSILSAFSAATALLTWAICPSGACTNTGHCKGTSNLSDYNSSKF